MNRTTETLILSDEFSRRNQMAIQDDLMDIFPHSSALKTGKLAWDLAESSGPSMRRTALNQFLYGSKGL